MKKVWGLLCAAAAASLVLTIIVLLIGIVVDVVGTEFRLSHSREAVRAALRGNCAAAYQEATKAGSVPYDASRLCKALSEYPYER